MLKRVYDLKSQTKVFFEMDVEIFNVENIIIRGCKLNEVISNRKCNNLSVNNKNFNNL
jgi:hypothetical protein